jgi:hypothetical protein
MIGATTYYFDLTFITFCSAIEKNILPSYNQA